MRDSPSKMPCAMVPMPDDHMSAWMGLRISRLKDFAVVVDCPKASFDDDSDSCFRPRRMPGRGFRGGIPRSGLQAAKVRARCIENSEKILLEMRPIFPTPG